MDIVFTDDYKKLKSNLEYSLEQAYKLAADEYLHYYQNMLKQYNYSRHKITFFCAMGSSSVMVDGKFLHERPNWKQNAALKLLWDIENSLDWDWSYHLDGKELN